MASFCTTEFADEAVAPATPPTVIATITAIPDQLDLSAVTLAVTVTVDGSPVTPDAVAWRVNAATTGIADATATTTTHTPTDGGVHVVTCAVTVDGIVYYAEAEVYTVGDGPLSVSIAAVPDQLTLDAITLDSTVTGGVGSKTYAWTVNGATTGLSSSTAADPTFTPTGGGEHVAVVTVTDTAGQTATTSVSFDVGVQDPTSKRWWVRIWRLNPAGQADHDFVSAALTVAGVEVRNGSEGAVTTCAISGGVMTVDTIAAGAVGGLWIYPVEARDDTMQMSYAMILAIGAEITADNDGVFMQYSNFGGSIFGNVEAYRASGVQRIRAARNGSVSGNKAVPGGGQARAIGMEWTPGRQSFRPLFSTTAHSGNGHSPVDMTAVALTPSGWHTSSDVTPAETADDFPADNNVGSNPVELVAKCRANNGRAYTFAEWSLWLSL